MKRGRPKTQFCPHGHNKDIVGRTKNGSCKECKRIKGRTGLPRKPRRRNQFCAKGHDKDNLGKGKDGHCITCKSIRERKKYADNIEQERSRSKKYALEHKEERRKYQQEYIEKNKEIIKKKKKKYRKEHKRELTEYNLKYVQEHLEEYRNYQKQYRDEHPEIFRLNSLRQEFERSLRIVVWGQRGIKTFYKKCPKKKVVDHYIPLQGEFVSGLHVIWNLQYLTQKQNAAKYNKCNLLEASAWYGKILEQVGLK